MGITGTKVTKKASNIILMDDNSSSIVHAIMWGCCINDAVLTLLQFQINTDITAIIIMFITAIALASDSAVQLLWINFIMDTSATLALAMDQATKALVNCKPDKRTDLLFTVDMIQ